EIMRALAAFSPRGENARFGVVSVGEGERQVEISTFRLEGPYSDMRRPDRVEFTKNLADDLRRRDFTVNAIAYNPRTGYIDPYDGRGDLKRGVLKTVSDARESFSTDALRILRLARFYSQLGLKPEREALEAAKELKSGLNLISADRLREELFLFVTGAFAADALLDCREIIFEIIPELRACDGFEQHNPNHCCDVFGHIALTLRRCSPGLALRLAALLHDVGKPPCFSLDETGRGHFWGHMEKGEEMAREILGRLGCPQRLADTVCALVLNHDKPYAATPAGARQWLARMGSKNIFLLIDLKKADCMAHAKNYHNRLARVYAFKREVQLALKRRDCYTLSALAVNGAELCDALDIKPGPKTGTLLKKLLEAVIAGEAANNKDELIQLAENYLNEEKHENDKNRA
ncbi:MAG: HD domain-containing protein, partial [Oscillospiraceae bacterium]|nr:HD domain-containing protein [Oscillospiraceae bacterium]